MVITMAKTILKSIAVVVALCVLYTLLLTIVFIPSNESVAKYAELAMQRFSEQPVYPIGYTINETDILVDNFSESLMIMATIKDDGKNPFEAGLSPSERLHYWDGYLVLLRPALSVMSYSSFKYLNAILMLCLFVVSMALLKKHLNALVAFSFAVAVSMCYMSVVAMSMHYFQVFVIMFLAVIFVLTYHNKLKTGKVLSPFFCYVFLIIGSLTSFFDILSTPIITIGFPLAVAVMLLCQTKQHSFSNIALFVVVMSAFWGFGYAATWAVKWIIAGIAFGGDVFSYVTDKFLFYGAQNEKYPTSYEQSYIYDVLKNNAVLYFNQTAVAFYSIVSAVFLGLSLVFRKTKKQLVSQLPLIFIALYPFVWYFIGDNHSNIHSFFTFRTMSVFGFAFLSFLAFCVDYEKLKQCFFDNKIIQYLKKTTK